MIIKTANFRIHIPYNVNMEVYQRYLIEHDVDATLVSDIVQNMYIHNAHNVHTS